MSNAHRNCAISMAVSLALLGAAARPGMAEPANTGTATADSLEEVIITGVRQSQIRAIQVKRDAPSIQDSITAESIGQLPDVTLTDALQRITGVQINRDAGTGTSVDVRGLPEVGTHVERRSVHHAGSDRFAAAGFHHAAGDVVPSAWTCSNRRPRRRPSAASAARSICTRIVRGICRADSPTAIPRTASAAAPPTNGVARRAGWFRTTAAIGVCSYRATTPIPSGTTRTKVWISTVSCSTAKTPRARAATTDS